MTESHQGSVEPRHLYCSVLDGLPYDLLVRQTELLLHLSQVHMVEIEGGEHIPRRPWWSLLSETQQQLFAALLNPRSPQTGAGGSGKQRQLQKMMSAARRAVGENKLETRLFWGPSCRNPRLVDPFVQYVLLRPPEAVHSYPAPDTVLILLSSPTETVGTDHARFRSVCTFSADRSPVDGPLSREGGGLRLPCPVDTAIFTPADSVPQGHRVLVIGCGDPEFDTRIINWLGSTDVEACTLFDPYLDSDPLAGPLPRGLEVAFVGAVPPAERARHFGQCAASLVAGDGLCRDNHFLQESLACGSLSLASFAGGDDPSFWTEERLKRAVGDWRTAGKVPAAMASGWSDAVRGIGCLLEGPGSEGPLKINGHRLSIGCSAEDLTLPADPLPETAVLCIAAGSRARVTPELLALANRFSRVHLHAPENAGFTDSLGEDLAGELCHPESGLEDHLHRLLAADAPPADRYLLCPGLPRALCSSLARELSALSAGTSGTEDNSSRPRILIRHSRPMSQAGAAAAGFVGTSVIDSVIIQGLDVAARDRATLQWLDLPGESTQLYFRSPGTAGDPDEDGTVHLHQLPGLLERGQIDLMYSGDPEINWSIRARHLWASKPVPVTGILHATDNQLITDQLIHLLLSGPTYSFDRFISPTECGARSWRLLQQSIEEWLARHTTSRPVFHNAVSVLPYGIETSQFQGLDRLSCREAMDLPRDSVVILSVGRFSLYGKSDLLPLLLACVQLLEKGHDIHLVLCGGGDPVYVRATQRMVERMGLSSQVRILPFLPGSEKLLLYGAADLFVSIVDNTQETYGVVILEAMAAGLPVVASEWNGYRELVRHGVTGFLVPTYWTDTTAAQEQLVSLAVPRLQNTRDLHESLVVDMLALVGQLESLIINKELRQNFGEAGRRLCRTEYDNVALGNRVLDLLDQSMEQARTSLWPPPGGAAPPFVDHLTRRFSHFPTGMVTGNEWIRPAPGSIQDKWKRLTLEFMTVTDEAERQLIQALLAEVDQSGQLTLDQLSDRIVRGWPYDVAEVRQRVLRCVKYGLLELRSS